MGQAWPKSLVNRLLTQGQAIMSRDSAHPNSETTAEAPVYKSWTCVLCGLVYNERDGWPDDGIPPGTRWQDVPEDWICPDCGAGKSDFAMVEV